MLNAPRGTIRTGLDTQDASGGEACTFAGIRLPWRTNGEKHGEGGGTKNGWISPHRETAKKGKWEETSKGGTLNGEIAKPAGG